MKARLAMLAVAGLSLGGCVYVPYSDPGVAGATALGAGLGAAAGAAIASGPTYYAPAPYYPPRPYGYGYGYYPRYGYRHW